MSKQGLRFSRHWVLAAAMAVTTAAAPVAAAATTYMDLASTGSPSEFPTKPLSTKNSGWIEVSSFSFGTARSTTNTAGGGGAAAGKESMTVTISDPTAAQTLVDDATRGVVLPVVRFYLVKPSPKGMIPYYIVTLTNAVVTSGRSTATSAVPAELGGPYITFNFSTCEVQQNDGWKTTSDPKSPIIWKLVQIKPPSSF
jgi:type VI protein secretion system component Hcp